MAEFKLCKYSFYEIDYPEYDPYWPFWRTNETGTAWEQLVGMSWECLEPPEELVKEFKAAIAQLDLEQLPSKQ